MKAWWVQVDEKDRLEAAVNALRSYPDDIPPVRIIPYWNHVSGLKFALLVKECFFDETSAQNHLNALHLKAAAKGSVMSGWNEGTVFYADPYRVLQ